MRRDVFGSAGDGSMGREPPLKHRANVFAPRTQRTLSANDRGGDAAEMAVRRVRGRPAHGVR